MRFIIHQSIAALQDEALLTQANSLRSDFSNKQHNISCAFEIFTEFREDDFKRTRIRESHVVFLSGDADLELIIKLKSMMNTPFIIWSTGTLSEKALNNLALPVDACLIKTVSEKALNQKKAPYWVSKYSNEEICSAVFSFQIQPENIMQMKPLNEVLSERILNAALRVHSTFPKVREMGEGFFGIISNLKGRDSSPGNVWEQQQLKKIKLIQKEEEERSIKSKETENKAAFSYSFWGTHLPLVSAVAAVAFIVVAGVTSSRCVTAKK